MEMFKNGLLVTRIKLSAIVSLFVLAFFLIQWFTITYIQLPSRRWKLCFGQFSTEIEQNNTQLRGKSAGLEESCPIQEYTIRKAEKCFKDVVETNFFSRFLLTGHKIKELERIKSLHENECGLLK